jgi:hypothetical protein
MDRSKAPVSGQLVIARRSDRIEQLLEAAAELWVEEHGLHEMYRTTENGFLRLAEEAYLRVLEGDDG